MKWKNNRKSGKGDIDKNVLMEYLIDDFDCEKIYDSDEELITDAFLH